MSDKVNLLGFRAEWNDLVILIHLHSWWVSIMMADPTSYGRGNRSLEKSCVFGPCDESAGQPVTGDGMMRGHRGGSSERLHREGSRACSLLRAPHDINTAHSLPNISFCLSICFILFWNTSCDLVSRSFFVFVFF